jgi:hypothetical protein
MPFINAVLDSILRLSFMQLALIASGAFILTLIMRAQLDDSDAFDLRGLIANQEGHIDRYSFAFMLGCTALTWAFIYYAWNFKIDGTDLLIYGLLMMFPEVVKQVAGPILAKRLGIQLPPTTPGA